MASFRPPQKSVFTNLFLGIVKTNTHKAKGSHFSALQPRVYAPAHRVSGLRTSVTGLLVTCQPGPASSSGSPTGSQLGTAADPTFCGGNISYCFRRSPLLFLCQILVEMAALNLASGAAAAVPLDADATALAAAAGTGKTVAHPRLAGVQQIMSAGMELGASSLARLINRLKDVKEREPTDDLDAQIFGDVDTCCTAAAAGQDAGQVAGQAGGFAAAAAVPSHSVNLEDAIEGSTLDEGTRWLAYATAAYAPTEEAIVRTLGEMGVEEATEACILYKQLVPLPLVPCHFIAVDKRAKVLVLAIRGTATLRDVIADMAARPIPFAGGGAHTGMAAAVDGLLHYRAPATPGQQPTDPKRSDKPQAAEAATTNVVGAAAAGSVRAAATLGYKEGGSALPGQAKAAATAAEPPPGFDMDNQSNRNPFGYSVPFVAAMAQEEAAAAPVASTASGIGKTPLPAQQMPSDMSRGWDSDRVYEPVETYGLGGVAVVLQRLLKQHQDCRIIITGHSLGAGVAALFTIKLFRILGYLRRQQLQKEAIANTGASASASSAPSATAAGATAAAADSVAQAAGQTVAAAMGAQQGGVGGAVPGSAASNNFAETDPLIVGGFLLGPRPLNCWAYAAPACMTPELSALSCLSVADMEDAWMQNTALLASLLGSKRAQYLAAQHQKRLQVERQQAEARAAAARASDAAVAAGADAAASPTSGVEAGPAGWSHYRREPLVTSVVCGDDLVPRLTVASLKDLAARLLTAPVAASEPATAGSAKRAAPSSTAIACTVPFWLLLGAIREGVTRCVQAVAGVCAPSRGAQPVRPATVAEEGAPAAASVRTTEKATHADSSASASATLAAAGLGSDSGFSLDTSYSAVMAPLARAELAEAADAKASAAGAAADTAPTGKAEQLPAVPSVQQAPGEQQPSVADTSMAAATRATTAAQAAAAAGVQDFAAHLRAAAVPEPIVQRVLDLTGTNWYDPSQILVPPGRIFYVARTSVVPVAAAGASRATGTTGGSATDGAAVACTITLTIDQAETLGTALRYRIRRVTPAQLRRIIMSPTMVTDHALGEYRAKLADLRQRRLAAGAGTRAAGAGGAAAASLPPAAPAAQAEQPRPALQSVSSCIATDPVPSIGIPA